METQDVKNASITRAKARVKANAEAKALAKDVLPLLIPMLKDEIKKMVREEAEALKTELQFHNTTLVSAKDLEEVLDTSYDNIRKMDKSHWPQVQLKPGGTRYIREFIVAAIAKE